MTQEGRDTVQSLQNSENPTVNPTGWNVIDVPLTFMESVGRLGAKYSVIVGEAVGFYADAGGEVFTHTPSEREQLGHAWTATRVEPLAETLLKRAPGDQVIAIPARAVSLYIGVKETIIPINPFADGLAGYDRLTDSPVPRIRSR